MNGLSINRRAPVRGEVHHVTCHVFASDSRGRWILVVPPKRRVYDDLVHSYRHVLGLSHHDARQHGLTSGRDRDQSGSGKQGIKSKRPIDKCVTPSLCDQRQEGADRKEMRDEIVVEGVLKVVNGSSEQRRSSHETAETGDHTVQRSGRLRQLVTQHVGRSFVAEIAHDAAKTAYVSISEAVAKSRESLRRSRGDDDVSTVFKKRSNEILPDVAGAAGDK